MLFFFLFLSADGKLLFFFVPDIQLILQIFELMMVLLDGFPDILAPLIHITDHGIEFVQRIWTFFHRCQFFHIVFLLKQFSLFSCLRVCFLCDPVLGCLHLQLADSCCKIFSEIHSRFFSKCKQRVLFPLKFLSCRIAFSGTAAQTLIFLQLAAEFIQAGSGILFSRNHLILLQKTLGFLFDA